MTRAFCSISLLFSVSGKESDIIEPSGLVWGVVALDDLQVSCSAGDGNPSEIASLESVMVDETGLSSAEAGRFTTKTMFWL